MRLRLRLGRTVLFLLLALIAMIALLPMRLAVDRLGFDERGLSARDATGTIWFGALHDVRFGPAEIGDVESRLHLLPLFLGRARLSLAGTDPAGVRGNVTVSRHAFAVDDVSGRVPLALVDARLAVPAIEFDDFDATFVSGRCVSAEGRVRATVAVSVAGFAVTPSVGGEARCAGDALLLPLIARGGTERLDVHLYADGRYRLELLVSPGDPRLQAVLGLAGFQRAGNAVGLRVDGRFQSVRRDRNS